MRRLASIATFEDGIGDKARSRNFCTPLFQLLTLVSFLGFPIGQTFAALPSAMEFRLATFTADVTPPLGHPLLGGATIAPNAKRIDDPLYARGFVLTGGDKPIVFVSIDWCEIRNDAYDRWRQALAEAAGTDPVRVLVTSVHQHDAPLADLEAQRILTAAKAASILCDPDYHERCVKSTAQALRDSLHNARRVTQLGLGEAKVQDVSSNRRYIAADGTPRFDRSSSSGGDSFKRNAELGAHDPMLKMLSFWDGDSPVCAVSIYAVHPMSYWGTGWVTSDFPGLAREKMQAAHPKTFQIYSSGASGNVTAGKFNDGRHDNRPVLTRKIFDAMQAAWKATRRVPLTQAKFRSETLRLVPRDDAGYTLADMQKQLLHPDPRQQSIAAMGLSWRKHSDAGKWLDLPVIDFGPAILLLLPGESYVEFQLLAQKLRPQTFVIVVGYGECGPGYVPIERAWKEKDGNLFPWCWVGPGSEKIMNEAIERALGKRPIERPTKAK